MEFYSLYGILVLLIIIPLGVNLLYHGVRSLFGKKQESVFILSDEPTTKNSTGEKGDAR